MKYLRPITAYLLMATFIIATTIGFAMILSLGAGLIALGVSSGISGYLLGAD
jgi:hypothetical protein